MRNKFLNCSSFLQSSKWAAFIFCFIWVIHPYKYGIFDPKITPIGVFKYELYWYIAISSLICMQFYLGSIVHPYRDRINKYINSTYSTLYLCFYSISFIFITSLFIIGFLNGDKNTILKYGPARALSLWFVTTFYFLPIFLNIFFIIHSYIIFFKKELLEISSEDELYKHSILIFELKRIIKCIIIGHIVFYTMALASFIKSGEADFLIKCIKDILGLLTNGNAENVYNDIKLSLNSYNKSSDIVVFLHSTIPPIIIIFFLISTINSCKEHIHTAISNVLKKSTNDIVYKMKFIFYDNNSKYDLYNNFYASILSLLPIGLAPLMKKLFSVLFSVN